MTTTTLFKNKENILSSSTPSHSATVKYRPAKSARNLKAKMRKTISRRRVRRCRPTTTPIPPSASAASVHPDLVAAVKHHHHIRKLAALHSRKRSLVDKLPLHLTRPAAIKDWECSLAGKTDLSGVPLGYVRDKFAEFGSRMLTSLVECTQSSKCSEPGLRPTHLLAITSQATPPSPSPSPSSEAEGSTKPKPKPSYDLHYTHPALLSTYCAALPLRAFPPPFPSHSSAVPIVPMSLPHPASFPLLQGYLYTHNVPGLLTSLIPVSPTMLVPSPSTPASNHQSQTIDTLSRTLTLPTLLTSASVIHALHTNATSLKVVESQFWETIEFAWEVVRGALERKVELAGKQLGLGSS